MKYFVLAIAMSFLLFVEADEYTEITPQLSTKLNIVSHGSLPDQWLRHYEFMIRKGHENVIPIFVEFDIDNVQTIIVTDMNATANKCGWKQQRHILHLTFAEPRKNQKKVFTRINKPCFVGRNAVLKLTVKTADNKYYKNITSFTASQNAFSPISHANYNATVNEPKAHKLIQDNKLKIKRVALEDSPIYWVYLMDQSYPGKDDFIVISADFDVKMVDAIMIEDLNAMNKKCGQNQVKRPLFLKFTDPSKNQKSITTQIVEPCYYKDRTKLKLSVKTIDNKYYYNTVSLRR